MASHKKSSGTIYRDVRQRLEGWTALEAGHKKSSGTIYNVAQRRPAGWPPWMAGHNVMLAADLAAQQLCY